MCNHREFESLLQRAASPVRIPQPLVLDEETRTLSRQYLAQIEAQLDADRRRMFWVSTFKEIGWYVAALLASIGFSLWMVVHR